MIDVNVDSDWAGDRQQRKGTSGGLVIVGGIAVKSWSTNVAGVSLLRRSTMRRGARGASVGGRDGLEDVCQSSHGLVCRPVASDVVWERCDTSS